jgi:ribonuclease HI
MATTVYTDGACINNQGPGGRGPGGWAWAVPGGAHASGAEADTTNQRMELTAALQAVRANSGGLQVVSDSAYVVNCFKQGWHEKWEQNGWKNAKHQPVENQDLWRPLLAAYRQRHGYIRFAKVKAHSGDPNNDVVDRLATEAARTQTGRSGAQPPVALGAPDAPSPGRAAAAYDDMSTLPGWRLVALGLRRRRSVATTRAIQLRPACSASSLRYSAACAPSTRTSSCLQGSAWARGSSPPRPLPWLACPTRPCSPTPSPSACGLSAQERYRQLLAGAAENLTLSKKQRGPSRTPGWPPSGATRR